MPIKYYLQPNPITPDPNDHSARVLANDVLDTERIIRKMIKRGSGSSESDIRAVLHLFFDVLTDEIAEGHNINLPIGNFRPGISGVFNSSTDSFYLSRHALKATLSAGNLLLQKIQSAKVEKILQPVPSPVILEYLDVNLGVVNSKLTPGGIGIIIGEELKFDPASPEEGIFFVSSTGASIKASVIATRTEGRLTFSIPVLAIGNYTLEVRRGYKNGTVIRTGGLSDILNVA